MAPQTIDTTKQVFKTYDDLIELLYILDKRIEQRYPGSDITIKIEAVGGFALLYHGLRIEDPASRDIDLYNELSSWVWKLAYDIDPTNWLNDGPNILVDQLSPSVKESMVFQKDTRYQFPYDHLQLWIATLESVLGMKLDALRRQAEDGKNLLNIKRTQDPSDVKEILGLFNIHTTERLFDEYPGLKVFDARLYSPPEYIKTSGAVNIFELFELFD